MCPRSRWTAVLLYGALTTACQVFALRELHAGLRGGEFAYGVTMAEWLVGSALGAALGALLMRRWPHGAATAPWYLLALGAVLPFEVVWARMARSLLLVGLTTGELPSVTQTALLPLLAVGPLAVVGGLGFPLMLSLFPPSPVAARLAYTGIALGDLVAGVALSLRPVAESLNLRSGLWGAALACLALATLCRRRWAAALVTLWAVAVAVSGHLPWVARWELASASRLVGRDLGVVGSFNTPHGSLVVTRSGGLYSLFQNGELLCSAPSEAVAEAVHYPLLTTSLAGARVLLLGGALSGEVAEVLRYGPERVDVVELDPRGVDVARLFLPEAALAPLRDPRVRLLPDDPRRWVRRADTRYDAIVVLAGSPSTLSGNRLFTAEFCLEARDRLRPGGVLVLSTPANASALSTEEASLAGCIDATLRTAFPEVAVLPGSHLTFVAQAPGGSPLRTERGEVTAYLRSLSLGTRLVIPETVRWSDEFDPLRTRVLATRLAEYRGRANRDLDPVACMYASAYWARLVEHGGLSGPFRAVLGWFDALSPAYAVGWIALAGGLLWLVRITLRARTGPRVAPFLACVTVAGMLAEIELIIAYQALYGFIYGRIGLLLAFVMGGAALGSHSVARLVTEASADDPSRAPAARRWLACVGLAVAVVGLLVAPVVSAAFSAGMGLGELTVFALALAIGGGLGAAYPLAVAAAGSREGPSGRSAGSLYAADLLGAAVGALVGSLLLVPTKGLTVSAVLVGAVVASALPSLAAGRRAGGPD